MQNFTLSRPICVKAFNASVTGHLHMGVGLAVELTLHM